MNARFTERRSEWFSLGEYTIAAFGENCASKRLPSSNRSAPTMRTCGCSRYSTWP